MLPQNCDCGPTHVQVGAHREPPGACTGHWPSTVVPVLKQPGMRWTLKEVARLGLLISLVAEMAATAVGGRDAVPGDGLGRGLGDQVPVSLELIPVAAARPSAFQPEHLDSNYQPNLSVNYYKIQLCTWSSVQFSCSVTSNSLKPHEPQHARLPCPSPTPGVYSNSCPLSR